jgi:hypothetical protein
VAAVGSEGLAEIAIRLPSRAIRERKLITAVHAVAALSRIASARPARRDRITRASLRVEHLAFETPACHNILMGHVKPGELPEQAAMREVREEAGIVATARGFVGRVHSVRSSRRVEVSYFVLDFLGDASPDDDRETPWCTPAQARRLLSDDELRVVLDRTLAR